MAESGTSSSKTSDARSRQPLEQSHRNPESSDNSPSQIAPTGSLPSTVWRGLTLAPKAVVASTPVDDEEVQFIFAAPRHRKKKRRRVERFHQGLQGFQTPLLPKSTLLAISPAVQPTDSLPSCKNGQTSFVSASHTATTSENPITSFLTPPELPRRVTTGMMCLKSAITRVDRPMLAKRGSLPSVSDLSIVGRGPPLKPSADHPELQTTKGEPEPEPFTDFPNCMDWWTDEIPTIQNNNPLLYGWNFYPPDTLPPEALPEPTKKGKDTKDYNSVIQDIVQPEPSIAQQKFPANVSNGASCDPGNNEKQLPNLLTTQPIILTQSPGDYSHTPPPIASLDSSNSHQSLNAPLVALAPKPPCPTFSVQITQRSSKQTPTVVALPLQEPIYDFFLPQTPQKTTSRQCSIQTPVASVPDETVSPRARTVEIPRQPNSSLYLSPYSAITGTKHGSRDQANISKRPRLQNSNISSTLPAGTTATPITVTDQRPITDPSDVLRKPSLYNIPPWPVQDQSTPPATISPQVRKQTDTCHQRCRTMNESSTSRAATHSITQNKSKTPPPSHLPRKHAPNLIVDIAETCQVTFPFAEVAARHKAPIQKVIDTFAAVIQLPLLRHAADNRRHGSLGKRRLKEFREAKKSMERATLDEDKLSKSKTHRRNSHGCVN